MNNNFEYIKQAIPQIASIQTNSSKMIKYIKECVEYVEQGIDFVTNFLQGYAVGLNIEPGKQVNRFNDNVKQLNKSIDKQKWSNEWDELNEQSEELSKKFDRDWNKLKSKRKPRHNGR